MPITIRRDILAAASVLSLLSLQPLAVMAQEHAQHQHQTMQAQPAPPTSVATDDTNDKAAEAAKSDAAPEAGQDHSKMDHSQMDRSQMDRSQMDHSQMDHSQMDHSQMDHSQMDHSQMDHSKMDHSTMDLPRTPIPVLTDADRAAAQPPPNDHPVHDNSLQSFLLVDRLEAWNAADGAGVEWEIRSWVGTDRNKLWLRSEGERGNQRTEAADVEVMYGHSIARWWDAVAGIHHDFNPGASQSFAAFGITGRAPYKFEVDATAYVGQSGRTAARLEVEYEALLTNRLILQPLLELDFRGKDDPSRGVGKGLSTAEAGLRLRYEIDRQFAPYIGLVHEHAFGNTANFRRAEGQDAGDTRLVLGVRLWF